MNVAVAFDEIRQDALPSASEALDDSYLPGKIAE